MEEVIDYKGQEQTKENSEGTIFYIRNSPVMQSAVEVLSLLAKKGKVILQARGNSIPNAVAVANILTEKMMRGNSQIQKITVDSEPTEEIGRMISTIEIRLLKI